LQREQAHDHLQAVHQAIIGLPAQYLATAEELVLLAQQGLVARREGEKNRFVSHRAVLP
jgi:hypothetical protein